MVQAYDVLSTSEHDTYVSSRGKCATDIDHVALSPSHFIGFHDSWKKAFPSSSPLHLYSARHDPETAIGVTLEAFTFVMRWIPHDLVVKLAKFPFDRNGPSAILIRGLPIDQIIPPTPSKDDVYTKVGKIGEGNVIQSTFVPVAESWLLGISRLLGYPVAAPFSTGDRGGLVRDITPNPGDNGNLPMHRDYPRQPLPLNSSSFEPEMFILLGVRADAWGEAKTVIIDSTRLVEAMDEEDARRLSETTVQIQRKMPDGTSIRIGTAFNAIDPNDGTVTLFDLPGTHATSPDGGDETVAAYNRMARLAFDLGERIELNPGDMLIINNCRLLHGRTKFDSTRPRFDGNGRWLVKSYVTNGLWGRPGTGHNGQTQFPNLNPVPWL